MCQPRAFFGRTTKFTDDALHAHALVHLVGVDELVALVASDGPVGHEPLLLHDGESGGPQAVGVGQVGSRDVSRHKACPAQLPLARGHAGRLASHGDDQILGGLDERQEHLTLVGWRGYVRGGELLVLAAGGLFGATEQVFLPGEFAGLGGEL